MHRLKQRWAKVVVAVSLLSLGLAAPPQVLAVDPAPAPATTAACPDHGALFEPPDGKTLLVIGQDVGASDAYVEGTGLVPGGFMTYSSVGGPVLGLHLPIKFGSTSHGQHFVDKYPHSVITVGMGITPFELTSSGAYDANLIVLADWIKAAKRPVFLRLGYEFDNGEKANDPAKFIAAWRHVVDKLREQNVTNAAFVWHSGSKGQYQGRPLSDWYPGDEYVDWMAVSLFRSFQLPYAHAMADLADAHGKPLMIGESTPLSYFVPTQPRVWDEWFVPVLDFISSRRVKIWSYINQNWEEEGGFPGWGDSRVQVDPAMKARWLDTVTGPRFLNASPGLMCNELGYGTPPDAPSVGSPDVTPAPSTEGSGVTAVASFSPAGTGTACTVDYGDGSAPVAGALASDSCTGPEHVYRDDGAYVVTVEVRNAGGTGSGRVEHHVTNVAPSVAVPMVTSPEPDGRRATARATFSDPGPDDAPFTCTVDYGDGKGAVVGTIAGGTCVGPPNQYTRKPSTYSVTVTVTDKDDASGASSTSHAVS